MARKKLRVSTPIKPPKVSHLKPDNFQHYLTLGELSLAVGKGRDWIRKLERKGRLPKAKRVQVGQLKVRLYPPETVEEIRGIFSTMRRGRPS